MLPKNLAASIISRMDAIWKRPYQLYIDGVLIVQPVIDTTGAIILDGEGNATYSNPKIYQLKLDELDRGEFTNLQDKTILYKVRLIRHESYNELISTEYDWELSFDGGENLYPFEVIKLETSEIEDFAWIITLGA